MAMMDLIELVKSITVATAFAVINILMRPPLPMYSLYLIELFISITFATLVGVILTDYGVADSIVYAFTAGSALLARDFLTFVIGFGGYVADRREALYKQILERILRKKG